MPCRALPDLSQNIKLQPNSRASARAVQVDNAPPPEHPAIFAATGLSMMTIVIDHDDQLARAGIGDAKDQTGRGYHFHAIVSKNATNQMKNTLTTVEGFCKIMCLKSVKSISPISWANL